ncbi:MAG: 5'-nucleotidase, lipoprotein e(P4) family [Pyrinomonadaceae bacterium]
MRRINFGGFWLAIVLAGSIFGQQGAAPAAVDNEYQLAAVLYMQKAAEYRALSYQAFNLARLRLDTDFDMRHLRKLSKSERKRPRAIIVDIDETVLDNSPAQAHGIRNRIGFNLKDWYAWGEMRKAKAIPGAVGFVDYAVSKAVTVFYVSNRDEVQKQATIDNLKSVGFDGVSVENVLLRTSGSGKDPRRKMIAEKYRIVMLIGDNLDDFSDVFEKRSVADRFSEVDRSEAVWGKRFIVLPNAMYGTWENAIYEYERLTDEQKAKKRVEALDFP